MNFIGPFFYGIATGFMMSVLLGVIFFMLIQVGITQSWKKGISIAAGVITGDILFVILAIGFSSYLREFLDQNEKWVALTGGCVLIIMGIFTGLQSRKKIPEEQSSGLKSARDYYLKPFLINLLNPANAAWWLGLYSVPPAIHYQLDQKIVFAIGAVATVFFTEIGVAAGASKLRKFITTKILKRVDMVIGIALVVLGLRLLLRGLGIETI